jgi:uncharacterized membrane protein YvlD (DUF360 family)
VDAGLDDGDGDGDGKEEDIDVEVFTRGLFFLVIKLDEFRLTRVILEERTKIPVFGAHVKY